MPHSTPNKSPILNHPPPPPSQMPNNATSRRNPSSPAGNTPSTTIHEISTHFSRLYLNHKAYSFQKPSTQPPPPIATHLQPESTTVSTAKSQNHSTSGPKNRGNPRYIYEEPQEESIKKAIVISTKEPPKNVKGYTNLTLEIQEIGGGGGGEVRKSQGYDVKMQSLASIGKDMGRRRSFRCSSRVEMADFLAFNGVKVVSADMPIFMQIHAVDATRKTYDSLEKFTPKTLALTLKKEFDGVYGPAWHCIVGLSFASFVTHSVGGFLYFSMDQKLYVLLFKTCVQKAHGHQE